MSQSPPDPTAATGPDDSAPREKRWSVRRKTDVVLRVLRGESLDALSRELNLPVPRIAEWRDEFLAAGEAGLKSRPQEASPLTEQQRRDLQAKVGELTMEVELLRTKVGHLEAGLPPAQRRSRR